MEWYICEKHKKKQKTFQRVLPNANICMNRYCPNSFIMMCSTCKHQHRDHSIKILTLEDIKSFLQKLVKTPSNNNIKYIKQSINLMKKIKFMKEMRKKIDYLETQILKQTSNLIEVTQTLMSQYSTCRQSAQFLTQRLQHISDIQIFQKFKETSKDYLSQLDYNFKKDRIELGNLIIKQKQDKRRKLMESTKRKIQQVRDYSMKIIQVILVPDDDSQSQQQQFQDSINLKKNIYKKLKQQLSLEKLQKKEKQKDQQDLQRDDQRSKSTTVSNNVKKFYESTDSQAQTCDQWIIDMRQQIVNLKQQLEQLKENKDKQQILLKQQIQNLNDQKLRLKKQVDISSKKLKQQKKFIKKFSQKLKTHLQKRNQTEKQKQMIYEQMLEIQSK